MTLMRRWILVLGGLTFIATMIGCGYRLAGYEQMYRDDVRTVAVPVVGNATFQRIATDPLSAALVRQLESRTPYRVRDISSAETVLEVTITDAGRGTLSRSRYTGMPDQQLFSLTASVRWRDLRNGELLLSLDEFTQIVELYPTLGESDFSATQEAAEQLAAGIIDELAKQW